jgi:alcohol dehydrogenase
VTGLADRRIEIVLRNRVLFGVGEIRRLGEVVAAAGGARVFLVTDPGVLAAGVADRAVADRALLATVFSEVEPNPSGATIESGATALRAYGLEGTVIIAIGGGSAMDAAKAIALRAANDRPLWDLEYDGLDLAPGPPIVAVPTTAGTGSEAHPFAVITHEEIGRKDYIGHPSLLPIATILDPALTVGLPPGTTAATGVDAMTHSLESLLSRNGNPFAESTALGVIRIVYEWLPRAIADGSDLEARSQMLMAAHLAGVGQASGTGVGLVHALGHALGTRGRLAHGTALAAVLPEVLDFYAAQPGLRERELALVGVAIGAASATEEPATAAGAAIGELRRFLADVGQRHRLEALGFDGASLDVVAQDAIDDVAIRNSPRLPTYEQARAILGSVLDRM